MRYGFGFSAPTPNVTRFLIAIIAIYLIFALSYNTAIGHEFYQVLSLDPFRVVHSFELWRIFTYGFLHDIHSPLHVIFNALMLYMIGTPIEEHFGENKFLFFILLAIGLGGIFVCLSYLLGLTYAPVVGFSAATIGLIVVFGITFSRQHIYVFGILPLSGKQLVFITVGLEIIYAISGNSISSAAHFGGIVAGFIFGFDIYSPRRLNQRFKRRAMKRNLRTKPW